jgi:hypothetical protein
MVRRLGWALDPRSFKIHTIAAPRSGRNRSTTCSDSGSGCRGTPQWKQWLADKRAGKNPAAG